MRKTLLFTFVTCTAALGTYIVVHSKPALAKGLLLSSQKRNFVAELSTKSFDANGVLRYSRLSTFAQKSDGSWAEERLSSNGHTLGDKIVFDVPTGQRISTTASVKAKATYALSPSEIAESEYMDGSCAGSLKSKGFLKVQPGSGERTSYLTFPAIRVIRAGMNSSGRQMTSVEEWLSPDFNCFPLRSVTSSWATISGSQSRAAKTVTEIISIREAVPDPASFEIPNDFVEKMPSEIIREKAASQNRQCQACEFAHGRLDAAYLSRRK